MATCRECKQVLPVLPREGKIRDLLYLVYRNFTSQNDNGSGLTNVPALRAALLALKERLERDEPLLDETWLAEFPDRNGWLMHEDDHAYRKVAEVLNSTPEQFRELGVWHSSRR